MIKLDVLQSLSHVVGEDGTPYALTYSYGWDGPAYLRTASGRTVSETVRKVCKRFRTATPEEIEAFAVAKASWERQEQQWKLRRAREDAERLMVHVEFVRERLNKMTTESLTQLFLSGKVPWRSDCEAMARLMKGEDADE